MELITLSRYLQSNPNFVSKPINVKDEDLEKMYVRYLKSMVSFSVDLQKKAENFATIAKEELYDAKNNRNKVLLAFNIGTASQPNLVGFAIIGTWPNACSVSDIYIQEFYIDKTHQRYGEEAMKLIADRYYLFDVSMFVIEKNKNAIAFWNHTMERLGYLDFAQWGLIARPSEEEMEEKKEEPNAFMYWRSKTRIA